MTQLCWEYKAAQICLPGKLLRSNLVLEMVLFFEVTVAFVAIQPCE